MTHSKAGGAPRPTPNAMSTPTSETHEVPTYCYNCVAGPDLLSVKVRDGVAIEVGPNFEAAAAMADSGKPCVKAYGLVQKTYNPHRVLAPMKRTNPRKGIGEDPGFVPIGWDEALDLVAQRLKAIRAKGLLDEAGLPRVAASFGHGGTPGFYMGSFNAFLAAWGPIDYSFGSGQGVKCTHSEHLYGEFWHRAFTVCADTPRVRYIIACGANGDISGGVCAVKRHADARVAGTKKVQVEPHLSVTGAGAAEWLPIRPKTDSAFLFALIHVMLHEHPRAKLDRVFLADHTSSPYLIGPEGWYLRDPESGKPLVWDEGHSRPVPFDHPGAKPALDGRFAVARAVGQGADGETLAYEATEGMPAFSRLVEHMRPYTPEWAQPITDIPAATIRRIAGEYLDHAQVGATVDIDGRTLPLRPVAVTLGKTVNNGWGAYECCWARTVLAVLVGALEVPGGTLGTAVRLHRQHDDRHKSVKPGPDGLMAFDFNPTDAERWRPLPTGRNAHVPLVPLVGDFPWSQALGPTHFAWMFQDETPTNWPRPTFPDLWFVYRCNPAISFWSTRHLSEIMARMPFVVGFAYTVDETNWMADLLLPEATDLESLQLIRFGGSKFVEQYWRHQGFVLRQPAVAPAGDSRDFTWIANELAKRTDLVSAYNTAINRGTLGVPLAGDGYDYKLDPDQIAPVETIWDRVCKAASSRLTGQARDLAWFKEHGFVATPYSPLNWYLFPTLADQSLRFELPYQERLLRVGIELGRRLKENGIDWWDEQLKEYQALPTWHDHAQRWVEELERRGAKPADYPFWLLTTKSMQYHTGGNVAIQLMQETSANVRGHRGIMINTRTAQSLGIANGDLLDVASLDGTTRGPAHLVQGIRPDVLTIVGQFAQWATPFAKDMGAPSLNTVAPMAMALTDSTGSGSDVVRVAVRKV